MMRAFLTFAVLATSATAFRPYVPLSHGTLTVRRASDTDVRTCAEPEAKADADAPFPSFPWIRHKMTTDMDHVAKAVNGLSHPSPDDDTVAMEAEAAAKQAEVEFLIWGWPSKGDAKAEAKQAEAEPKPEAKADADAPIPPFPRIHHEMTTDMDHVAKAVNGLSHPSPDDDTVAMEAEAAAKQAEAEAKAEAEKLKTLAKALAELVETDAKAEEENAKAEKADRVKRSRFQARLAVDGVSGSSQITRGDAAEAKAAATEAKVREVAQTKTSGDTEVEADDPRERERVRFSLALAAARQAEQEARQAEEAAQQAELTRFLEEAASGMDTWERKKRQSAAYEQAESETEAAASGDDEGSSPPDEATVAELPLAKPSFYMRGDEDALMMAIAAEEAAAAAEASVSIVSAAPSVFAPAAAVRNLNLAMEKKKRYAITWLLSAITWLRAHVGACARASRALSYRARTCGVALVAALKTRSPRLLRYSSEPPAPNPRPLFMTGVPAAERARCAAVAAAAEAAADLKKE